MHRSRDLMVLYVKFQSLVDVVEELSLKLKVRAAQLFEDKGIL